jgi:hypothetical protein
MCVCERVLVQNLAESTTPRASSTTGESSFMGWWQKANERALGPSKKSFKSLIILGAWTLWKHRNRCVFDVIAPNLITTMSQADEERRLWELAGARGISHLIAHLPEA